MCAGRVERMEYVNKACRILVLQLKTRRLTKKCKGNWVDNIKMNLKLIVRKRCGPNLYAQI
jgi:hypothetical protein